MTGDRFRMVTIQEGHEHVSTVVLGEEEAHHHLELEATFHELARWKVEWTGDGEIVCTSPRTGKIRRVLMRRYSPLGDICG